MVLGFLNKGSYSKIAKDKKRTQSVSRHERTPSAEVMNDTEYDFQRAIHDNNSSPSTYRSAETVNLPYIEPMYSSMIPKCGGEMRVDSNSKEHEDWFHFSIQTEQDVNAKQNSSFRKMPSNGKCKYNF
jgi:hypothetical protein